MTVTETQRIVAPEAAVRLVHRGMLRDYLDEQQPTADPWHNRRMAGDLEELMHAWIEAARVAERRAAPALSPGVHTAGDNLAGRQT